MTRGIELTVHFFNLQFDVKFWSQYVSFILIGIIVITSIRGLLITLTKVHIDRTPSTGSTTLSSFSSSFSISSPVLDHPMSSFYV